MSDARIARMAGIAANLGPSAVSGAPLPTEHHEQCAVIDWWAHACKGWNLPEFALFAIPNAGAGAQRGQAGKMKGEGVRRGIPDLMLAVPKLIGPQHDADHYAGLFVEMKRKRGGRLSPEQREVADWLASRGYRCVVCNGADEAMLAIKYYLG